MYPIEEVKVVHETKKNHILIVEEMCTVSLKATEVMSNPAKNYEL